MNAEARASRDAIHEKRFPGSSDRLQRPRQGGWADSVSRGSVSGAPRLGSLRDEGRVWVARCRAAQTPGERLAWLGLVREILEIVLQSVPAVTTPFTLEIDGLPSDFDDWAFRLAARTIPCLTSAEHPEQLWQPILDRAAPAHQWVERFFWHWFTDGLAAAPSAGDFVQIWRSMIARALEHSAWDPAGVISHELDGIVFELLGFDMRWNAIVRTDDNAQVVGSLEDIFERALRRWAGRPKIISGLVTFAVQPGAKQLLMPTLRWASTTARGFDAYDWKYGLEENMIEFLHSCWQQAGASIAGDETLRASFLAVLTILVSRGSHAAIALNARVVGSIGG